MSRDSCRLVLEYDRLVAGGEGEPWKHERVRVGTKIRTHLAPMCSTDEEEAAMKHALRQALSFELLGRGADVLGNLVSSVVRRVRANGPWSRSLALPDELVQLREDNAKLREFVEDIQGNFDCDEDGHRYRTHCRVCDAEKLLAELKRDKTE